MSMVLLPAVDVAGGQSVRPRQGEQHSGSVYGPPLATALDFQAAGAEWVHLVDLDAAFGRGSNADLLADVVRALDVKVELAGGIRDEVSLRRALATGCDRVVLSTDALKDLPWCLHAVAEHGERVVIGLDVRLTQNDDSTTTHRLSGRGSVDDVGELWETLSVLDNAGGARYVVTDVSRDGMLHGPNLDLLREVANASAAQLVASGGVASIDDLVALAGLSAAGRGVEGAIVGTALYEGRFTLSEAVDALAHNL